MGPESSRPTPDESQRLTFKDLGVSKSELDSDTNVVNLEDYRQQKQGESNDLADYENETSEEKKKTLKPKAILLAGAAVLGSYALMHEAFSEKIQPIENNVEKRALEVEDIKPGDVVSVSPYTFSVTGGNVRSSASVAEEGENLVDVDMRDKELVHPIKVVDETNSANGYWYVFYDAKGEKFAINEKNVVPNSEEKTGENIKVTITETANTGIIGVDEKGNSTLVAAVNNNAS